MRYPLSDQLRLLDLQAVDSELRQVRHRMRRSPLSARVTELEDRAAALHRRLVETRTQSQDLERGIARSEDELAKVKARLARDRDLAGQGASAKVQRELQHELTSLTRRLSDLEDAELELLERQDQLTADVARLQAEEEELAGTLAHSRRERDEVDAEGRRREAELGTARAAAATGLPADLLSAYETSLRDTGTGAARLVGNQCGGCRMQLPPNEVARLLAAPVAQVEFCDECGCILVRDSDP